MLFAGDGDSRRREGSNSGGSDENDDGYDDRGGGRDGHKGRGRRDGHRR